MATSLYFILISVKYQEEETIIKIQPRVFSTNRLKYYFLSVSTDVSITNLERSFLLILKH